MADLRTNYKDDILSTAEQGTRKFNIVDANGNVLYESVHLEDVSNYLQVGDEYGADEINEQNEAINNINADLFDWMPYDNYIIKSDTDYTDVLLVSLSDAHSENNRPHKVFQQSGGTALRNMPSDFPQGTEFVGFRYVHYFNPQNILVELINLSNYYSYFNKYDGTGWSGWRRIDTKNTRRYADLVTSNLTVAANGGTATFSKGSTAFEAYEIMYYGYGGWRQSVVIPTRNVAIPLHINATTMEFFSISSASSNGIVTITNNTSQKLTITKIYGLNFV